MDSLGLKDAFRLDVDDNVEPFLWSDELIATYADEAQKMFCRLTNGISDSSSPMCSVDIEAGEPTAALDKRILKVRRAMRASDARPITLVNVEEMDSLGVRLTEHRGQVSYAILGMDENSVRWVNVPALNDTALLTVYRLPLRTITAAKTALEIPEQHHRSLLMWMEHLAYGRQDTDTYDPRKAERCEAAFTAYCAQAKAEQDRARSKVRVVRYGDGGYGGGGGGPGGGYGGHRGNY
jgi:hypothetical protein